MTIDIERAGRVFAPTDQQEEILAAVRTGEDVTVRALAGTGKTSTLALIAESLLLERPEARIVYLAFNKSVQVEAQGRFPSNVETRTADSVAWKFPANAALIAKSSHSNPVSPDALVKALNIEDVMASSKGKEWMVAGAAKVLRLARTTVDNFCITADDTIEGKHLAQLEAKDSRHSFRINPVVLKLARRIWEDILDPYGVVPVTNTHVTKNWALSNPDLSKQGSGLTEPVDIIFFDEAQDVNEVLGDVVARQRSQKIIVGDANQAIYAWRGAVDYLDKVETVHDLALTRSFRFGQEIAHAGNEFLKVLKSPLFIEGAGASGSVSWQYQNSQHVDAVITRTNAGAIRAIMNQMAAGKVVKIQPRYAEELKRLIISAEWLKSGGDWKTRPKRLHEELMEFKDWNQVALAAQSEESHYAKVKMLYNLVIENGIERLAEVVDATVTSETASFDVTVQTGHSAKGLEWDNVLVFDDFWAPVRKHNGHFFLVSEEVRLAYVAVTRAKKNLFIAEGGLDWILNSKVTNFKLDSELAS